MISKELYDNLDNILKELGDYIKSTYGEHYVGNDDVQTIDFFESLGSAQTTFRDNAIKYLSRYGKKDGNAKKDLMKPLHYILMILQMDHPQKALETPLKAT